MKPPKPDGAFAPVAGNAIRAGVAPGPVVVGDPNVAGPGPV